MRTLLIAMTICMVAGTSLASASPAHAAGRRVQRAAAGMSMKSVMSGLMASGVMSEISGAVPGGLDGIIPGANGAGGGAPASIGTLRAAVGGIGGNFSF